MNVNIVPDEKLLAPYFYISELPGKQIRTKLSKAFNHWLNIPDDKIELIVQIIQMLHNASLLVDDIEDDSKMRRGRPVAHTIYGCPLTINAANFIYFLALDKVLLLGHAQAIKIYTELLELHRGQGMDIYWRDSFVCPSEEEYFSMVAKKTGGLFRLAFKLMQLFSSNQSDYTYLLNDLAIYFQIRDDYANLLSPEYHENKAFCEDLTEGKYSFPIIHGINQETNGLSRIRNILKRRTDDPQLKTYCVEVLKESGSFKHTLQTLNGLEEKIREAIAHFGGNDLLLQIIDNLKIKN
ncbi:geranylgeranyl pyrophosphate synthase-like isoform X2 [Gordionus sp. m RMFG-2023]|uniref:geranylgeranyl pyrophosphate synthase-like isoform X2 n=1 Tax=Gordionus sp. m RMFG-2023 TaxID=3053472 RepID=UPI0031FBCC80